MELNSLHSPTWLTKFNKNLQTTLYSDKSSISYNCTTRLLSRCTESESCIRVNWGNEDSVIHFRKQKYLYIEMVITNQ